MVGTVKLQLDKWFRKGDVQEETNIQGEAARQQVINLQLDTITPSPYQTRTEFEEIELRELAQSIKEFGVIQPVIVRGTPGGYELVAGERRVRASRLVGLQEIPALIVEMSDEKAAAVTLIENVQRTALNYLEEAEAYQLLLSEFGLKQEELARQIGKSQSTVANKIRLLKLPPEVRNKISVDKVSERHARALLQIADAEQQLQILKTIMERELTVKDTEELIHNTIQPKSQTNKKSKTENTTVSAARSYINSIKQIVYQARENGVNIVCMENRQPEGLELLIKVAVPPSEPVKKKPINR